MSKRDLTLFVADVTFDDSERAMLAQRELIAAGYEVKITEEGWGVHAEVSRSTRAGRLDEDALRKQLDSIVEPFDGLADSAGLIEDPTLERRSHRLQ